MNMNQGIKMFGEAGVEAVKQEMQQLHNRGVMMVKEAKELTREQKKEALAYLMFLKRKHGGKSKVEDVQMEESSAHTLQRGMQHCQP